ncbi:MAG: UDP-N-acetylglucosamine 2-epimerase (hydrolyzing) [Gammaproteobacteria bacterium]|nr:UDP-N-acetylglucosamine 2-epimerase (hydrolyzing) [Gammaproteobacteria bacterium]
MNTPRRICAVTGSRADWGLLRPVLDGIRAAGELQLQLAVTGSHLSFAHGHTVAAIETEGFDVDARIDLAQTGDDARAVTHALGRGVLGFADALQNLAPDLLLVLGDRYEILAAVQAALIARVPVAHIAGGDITEGAFDDAIRHAISKLSHLHFATHADAARRLKQMGEANVFLTGSPGIDQILATPRLTRTELSQSLEFPLRERNLAITFHPATLENAEPLAQLNALLTTLDALCNNNPDTGLIFTGSNSDTSGEALNTRIAEFVATRNHACLHPSLGQQRYYSLVAEADAVVGNSSSGLYEAPSLGTPTVNIGSRQHGRPRAASVVDCSAEIDAIAAAINTALTLDLSGVENPYGDGHAAGRILAVLRGPWTRESLIHKRFVDWEHTP